MADWPTSPIDSRNDRSPDPSVGPGAAGRGAGGPSGNWLAWGLILAVSAVPLVPLACRQPSHDYANLPQLLSSDAAVAVIMAIWVVYLLPTRDGARVSALLYGPMGVLLLWSGISAVWAVNRCEAFTLWVHWAVCFALLYLVPRVLTGRRHVRGLLTALFASATLVALVGLLQTAGIGGLVQQTRPPSATFGNKNHAADFVASVFPIGLVYVLTVRRGVHCLVCVAGTTVLVSYLFLTFSVGSWLAVFASCGVITTMVVCGRPAAFQIARPLAPRLALLLVPLVICSGLAAFEIGGRSIRAGKGGVPLVYREMQEAMAGERRQRHALETRLRMWLNSSAMARDFPLRGVGLGNWHIQYPRYCMAVKPDTALRFNVRPSCAHNDYIQLITELGLIGGIMLVVVLWRIVRECMRSMPRVKESGAASDLVATFAGLIALSISSLFSFPMYRAVPPLVAACYVGLVTRAAAGEVGVSEIGKPGPTASRTIPPGVWWTMQISGGFLAALLALALVLRGIYWRAADLGYYRSGQLYDRGAFSQAVAGTDAALRRNPCLMKAHFLRGRALLAAGDYRRAGLAFSRFASFNPHDPGLLFNLALLDLKLGCPQRALARVATYVDSFPDAGPGYALRGEILAGQGEFEKALAAYRRATEETVYHADTHYNHAAIASHLGHCLEARRGFRKAIHIAPGWWPPYVGLSVIQAQYPRGADKACGNLRKALSLEPPPEAVSQIRELMLLYGCTEDENTPAE